MNRRAFVLGSVMLLLGSLAAVALRAFAETTFLKAYGTAQAPWLLIATAAGFAFASLGYDALTRFAHSRLVDLGLLTALAVVAAASPALLARGLSPAVIVIVLTAASQVAILALWNRVAAAVAGRDARRMLPRAGAAVTLGGAVAGLGAGLVIPRAGLASLPYAAAVVIACAVVVCVAQERALTAGGAPGGEPGGPGAPRVRTGASPAVVLSMIQRALLAAMIATAALEAIVTTVIDLQFLASVKARYAGEELAIAIALFYGGTNAILFVLQIAAVPRILVTRSLPFTAAIHPALVLLSYLGFAVSPGFFAIAGTRTTDQVLRLATSRTSQELALSALPPAARARWKVLLRGLVYPAGVVVSALVLFALGPAFRREPKTVAFVAMGAAIIWAIAARIAARRFQAALAAPLGIREARRDDPRCIDLETLERWTHVAGAGEAKAAALARAALHRARVDPGDLADHLRHDDAAVRAAMFAQLARTPVATLRAELRAAIAIEDDDRALALGIKALTIAGDDSGVRRGKERAGLSREIDDVTRSAALVLAAGDVAAELPRLLAREPAWAVAIMRARRADLGDVALQAALVAAAGAPATRAGAWVAIARVGKSSSLALLAAALEDGEPAALAAIATLGELEGDHDIALTDALVGWSALARATTARALAGAPAGAAVLAALVVDADPEVAQAALRTALAFARGGTVLRAASINAALDVALAALAAHLDARDDRPAAWSACHRTELEVATRRCVARVLWASAVDAAAAGRDPSPITVAARRMLDGSDADRKRALDVVQELRARPAILEAIERWIRQPTGTGAARELVTHDAWLARLVAGELAALEPALVALRAAPLFASLAGPALASLAGHAERKHVTGVLFEAGDAGDSMFVVAAGSLVAHRAGSPAGSPERRIEPGGVVGELAVLTRAARAATVSATSNGADVLEIDRAVFAAAARRAPELVFNLSATLAGWLAAARPDVL